jgi:hypothetical protein
MAGRDHPLLAAPWAGVIFIAASAGCIGCAMPSAPPRLDPSTSLAEGIAVGNLFERSPAAAPSGSRDFNADSAPQALQPGCEGAECCPVLLVAMLLTADADTYLNDSPGLCLLGLDGDDVIHDQDVDGAILAGPGNDLVTSAAARLIAGGEGDDEIEVSDGIAEIDGGDGDDTITTLGGDHIITPGPGVDNVVSGPGSVIVQVLDTCELQPGESLHANGDDDLIILPVELSQALDLGVDVVGFERIIVAGPTCRSTCVADIACEQGAPSP